MATLTRRVFEIEFAQALGSCQASIRSQTSTVAVTTIEPRMQTILETAMIMSMNVDITYDETADPKVLRRVRVNID